MADEQNNDVGCLQNADASARIAPAVARLENDLGRTLTPTERLCVLVGYSYRMEAEIAHLDTLLDGLPK